MNKRFLSKVLSVSWITIPPMIMHHTALAQDISKGIPSTMSPEIINKCLAIKSDPERLRCFETITENSTFGDKIKPDDPLKIIKAEDAERGETSDLSIQKPTVDKPKTPTPTVQKPQVKSVKNPLLKDSKSQNETQKPSPPNVKNVRANTGNNKEQGAIQSAVQSALGALQKSEKQDKENQQKAKQNTQSNTNGKSKENAPVSRELKSNWQGGQGKHPTTKLPVTYLYTYALESLTTPDGDESTPYLMLRCHDKTITAFINYPYYYMGKKPLKVAYVIDGEPAIVDSWLISADGQSAGLFRQDLALDFIKPLYGQYHLEVATRPQNKGNPITVNFDISGLKVALGQMALYCPFLLEE